MIKTKIVATIGPSTWDFNTLKDMFEYGFRIARLNSSFADFNELKRVKELMRKVSPEIGLMMDTQGPKIRLKNIEDKISLKAKDSLRIWKDPKDKSKLTINYPSILKDITKGIGVLIDDGNIKGNVEFVGHDFIDIRVLNDGIITEGKTINIPYINLNIPLLTEQDINNIKAAVELDFDFISTSFVQNKEDIINIKNLIKGSHLKIIAKIETANAVLNFEDILSAADGIMVARGDLGVELPIYKLPLLQKQIIKRCKEKGKPVIVATQMLESMKTSPRPTRAEVSDVANAILDGTDAVMLSAETSVGKYPTECVKMMYDIANEVEHVTTNMSFTDDNKVDKSIVKSAVSLAQNIKAQSIIVFTKTGYTAKLLSSLLPSQSIFALISDEYVARQLGLSRNVYPLNIENKEVPTNKDEFIIFVKELIKDKFNVETGHTVIVNVSSKDSKSMGIIEAYET